MKKLLIGTVAAVVCSTAFAASTTTTSATTSASTSMPAAATTGTPVNATTTVATLTITPNKKASITAVAHISWALQSTEKLVLTWNSPVKARKGDCHDSTVKIKTGTPMVKSTRILWYQTPNGAPVACTGTWVASVVNLTTGKTLATAQYNNTVQ